jgi:hypothetical protein
VYIAKGSESRDIKYLKKLLGLEPAITTEIGVTMNYSPINKEWKDMFIDAPHTNLPPLRPDKFNFHFQNPSTAQASSISNDEWDEIRER